MLKSLFEKLCGSSSKGSNSYSGIPRITPELVYAISTNTTPVEAEEIRLWLAHLEDVQPSDLIHPNETIRKLAQMIERGEVLPPEGEAW